MKKLYITDFHSILPAYCQDQDKTLDWIARMHAMTFDKDPEIHYQKLSGVINKIGLGPGKINTRYMFFDDFFKSQIEEKIIYHLDQKQEGAPISQRVCLYNDKTLELFETFYENKKAPSHLIHTTCTGYSSPSAAQKLVSSKTWGAQTQVTHAYHMGCYASIPSIRMGLGMLSHADRHVDVVHTEFCTLHMNPSNHSMSQLVIESLFADGAIKYSLKNECDAKGFEVLAVHEMIIPDSMHDMMWDIGSHSFDMKLSKDVPSKIAAHLEIYLNELEKLAKTDVRKNETTLFAIHPGGPKIIDKVAELLSLKLDQYRFSLDVLKTRGNMSSATLPHVWEKILNDETVNDGTYVVSMAFGPGLTIAGCLLKKVIYS